MNAIEFRTEIKETFASAYEFIRRGYIKKIIQFPNSPSYNSQLRVAETEKYFVAELLGSKEFKKEIPIDISIRSIEKIANVNGFVLGVKQLVDAGKLIIDATNGPCNIASIFIACTKDLKKTINNLITAVNNKIKLAFTN